MINEAGHLVIGGCDTAELVKEFGTPLYVTEQSRIENTVAAMVRVLNQKYPDSRICFASKAFCCKAVYQIIAPLGLGADVASGGELYTALSAGMDPARLYFHGNNKRPDELDDGVRAGVHAVVVDNADEIQALNAIAAKHGKTQGVLIRINPGVEAHTHRFIQTARADSKFGFSVEAALSAVKEILGRPNLDFLGIHCHIGSQIVEAEPFMSAVDRMTDLMVLIRDTFHVNARELNMGGGYGIRYTAGDNPPEPHEYVGAVADKLITCIAQKGLKPPRLIVEPGRSLVGEAGITLYRVGAVKDIPGVRKYVSVDGGMYENPRYALYDAKYDAVLALRALEPATETVTIAGKCCEAGDMVAAAVELPKAEIGDILAVLSTGAYNYSMASNYNRNPVPPVVLCKDGKARYIVAPQTYGDITARDIDL